MSFVSDILLKSVENYVIFTGDVIVHYTVPGNVTLTSASIELVTSAPERVVIALSLGTGTVTGETGELRYRCGFIDTPGTYHFRLLSSDSTSTSTVVARSRDLHATWPRIHLRLPQEHKTLEGFVNMPVTLVDDVRCRPENSSVEFAINLQVSSDESFEASRLRLRSTLSDLQQAASAAITLACSAFDVAGWYRVTLVSSSDEESPIAVSNTMDVTWSLDYRISPSRSSVFACDQDTGLPIAYTQPTCPGSNDKIRLYKQVLLQSGYSRVYMSEQRALRGGLQVSFPCSDFDINAYGYCFIYRSFAENEQIFDQDEVCVRTRDAPGW